jgi:primosomal protein N'
MNVIEVIPIKKGSALGTLTYFTSQDIYIGSIVSVPVRNKKVKGIVVSVKKAQDIKTDIKRAGFALKKIEKIKAKSFFTKNFTDALSYTSDYFAGSIGSTINSLVPDYIFENIDKIKLDEVKINKAQDNDINNENYNLNNQKIYLIDSPETERYTQFRNIIRHEFAKKKSLFFIYPNAEQTIHGFNLLKKGIEKYSFLLHGNLTKKEIISTWNNILEEQHPVVIICSYAFLSIDRSDLGTIVIENENSKGYKIQKRPYIDIRYFIEQYAKQLNIDLYYSGDNIRTETIYRKKIGEIININSFENNTDNHTEISIVDMKKKSDEQDKEFKTKLKRVL